MISTPEKEYLPNDNELWALVLFTGVTFINGFGCKSVFLKFFSVEKSLTQLFIFRGTPVYEGEKRENLKTHTKFTPILPTAGQIFWPYFEVYL